MGRNCYGINNEQPVIAVGELRSTQTCHLRSKEVNCLISKSDSLVFVKCFNSTALEKGQIDKFRICV